MHRLVGILLCWAVSSGVAAQAMRAGDKPEEYPQRPIRIIVPVVPGGGLDIIVRSIGQMLHERWGQSVIVDNRPGAGGLIGIALAAKSTPDGYTFLAGTDGIKIAGATKRLDFDVRKAFDPIVPISAQPYILIVGASVPAKSIKELVAQSKSAPVSYGSSGVGTVAHLGLETLTTLTGARFVHVPYKGGAQSLLALMGGEIQMYPGLLLSAGAALKSGKVRALAALSLKRIPAMPDLPTVAEQGYPDFKIVNTYGLYAPAGIPRPAALALNQAVGQFMNSPQMAQRLIADGSQAGEHISPDAYKALYLREYEEVKRQVKNLKVKIF